MTNIDDRSKSTDQDALMRFGLCVRHGRRRRNGHPRLLVEAGWRIIFNDATPNPTLVLEGV